jgi:uncharacterized membrane protein
MLKFKTLPLLISTAMLTACIGDAIASSAAPTLTDDEQKKSHVIAAATDSSKELELAAGSYENCSGLVSPAGSNNCSTLAPSVSENPQATTIGPKGSAWLFEKYVEQYREMQSKGLTIKQYLLQKKENHLEVGEHDELNLNIIREKFINDDGSINTDFHSDSMSNMYRNLG